MDGGVWENEGEEVEEAEDEGWVGLRGGWRGRERSEEEGNEEKRGDGERRRIMGIYGEKSGGSPQLRQDSKTENMWF